MFFRQKAQFAGFALKDGLAVEVRATASIYEARGEFQLNVETMRLAGIGALYEKFERLKARLAAAGLVRRGAQAPAAGISARRRHRDVAARRGARRHPHDAAAPLAAPCR